MQMTDRLGRRLSNRRIERRVRIMSVTLDLIAAKGYDAVTVSELAAASGVSKKTLYDIYGSKEDVLAAAVAGRIADVLCRIQTNVACVGLDKLPEIIRQLIDADLEIPTLSRALAPLLIQGASKFKINTFFHEMHRKALLEMRELGQLAEWADIDFAVQCLMMDHISTLNIWAGGGISDEQLEAYSLIGAYRIVLPLSAGAAQQNILGAIRRIHNDLASSHTMSLLQ